MKSLAELYDGARVLVTGHTGFKGAWLSLVLDRLGAHVTGVSLGPQPKGIFELGGVASKVESHIFDIRDRQRIADVVAQAEPEFVFHLAAQSLVPESYDAPVETFDVNVVGTASVLAACTPAESVRAVVAVTSDKVYANDGSGRAFAESDPLGGGDPYSASKSATEMVVSSWRYSFLGESPGRSWALGSARAGNVIGGGDRASNRVVPDIVRALETGSPVRLRNPQAVRPWQFVLEPVVGYLMYAASLVERQAATPSELNFGPSASSATTVETLVDRFIERWGGGRWEPTDDRPGPEASVLLLDSARAASALGWRSCLDLDDVIRLTVDWYRCAADGGDCAALSVRQVDDYLSIQESSMRGGGS